MKLLIVGLGSMGKRRARLSKGIDAALHIVGVDTAEARRAEACTLGLADAAYPTIAEAVAAEHPDAAHFYISLQLRQAEYLQNNS